MNTPLCAHVQTARLVLTSGSVNSDYLDKLNSIKDFFPPLPQTCVTLQQQEVFRSVLVLEIGRCFFHHQWGHLKFNLP